MLFNLFILLYLLQLLTKKKTPLNCIDYEIAFTSLINWMKGNISCKLQLTLVIASAKTDACALCLAPLTAAAGTCNTN